MFIPIGDDNARVSTRPWITWLIFAICAYVWYRQLYGSAAFTMGWSAVPYEVTHGIDLVSSNPLAENAQAPGPKPIQFTLISSMFMHGGWLHIIGNMVYLLVFADQIEHRLGHFRFLIFYVICGLIAGLAQVLSQPNSLIPILGASGAIAAVLGAYLFTTPRNRVTSLFFIFIVSTPAWVLLPLWFVLQVLALRSMDTSQVSNVAYLAHISGFIAGAILVHVMTPRSYAKRAR